MHVLILSYPELKGTEQIKAAFDKFFSSTKVSTNLIASSSGHSQFFNVIRKKIEPRNLENWQWHGDKLQNLLHYNVHVHAYVCVLIVYVHCLIPGEWKEARRQVWEFWWQVEEGTCRARCTCAEHFVLPFHPLVAHLHVHILHHDCRLRLWTRVGRVWKREQKEFTEWW